MTPDDNGQLVSSAREALADPVLGRTRLALAKFTAEVFEQTGSELHVIGFALGPDRATGMSPWGNGTDETVGVSVLLRVGAHLTAASADLVGAQRTYAAGALVRQLVEVEYLAWAFGTRDKDAEKWLRSSKKERETFFSPGKIRKAAAGKFRGVDYSLHCELGGHPVPVGSVLLQTDTPDLAQFLLADMLGHVGRTWDHIVAWARRSDHGEVVLKRELEMLSQFSKWKDGDPLASLPPPDIQAGHELWRTSFGGDVGTSKR